MKSIPIELLSPAKNAEFGMAAISFGADAVYIGAPKFSARAAAGNTVADIEKLCSFAHKVHARVYVALNTILFDHELQDAEKLIHQLWNAGADALIIQDMGILEMNLPPIALHASTQANNVSPKHIAFLEKCGFSRVILARELSVAEMSIIAESTSIELEAFVHGALCVSQSGQCYMSAFLGNRSGNRGDCAQPCRLEWNTLDEQGHLLQQNSHVLSLRDMNRSNHLDSMIKAGIRSFKIEGRMKDMAYLKNITAHYRMQLDELFRQHPEYAAASLGKCQYEFIPDPDKTFNRGYTNYLAAEKEVYVTAPSPKSLGQRLGTVSECNGNRIKINTNETILPGDGLCYFNHQGQLEGFSVQKAEQGIVVAPAAIHIRPGTLLYRNHDMAFQRQLQRPEQPRKIGLNMMFEETNDGFRLTAATTDWLYEASAHVSMEKTSAREPEKASETLEKQLIKTGGTMFQVEMLNFEQGRGFFLPVSVINELRREVIEQLGNQLGSKFRREEKMLVPNQEPYCKDTLDYKANVANRLAQKFWERHEASVNEKAFELLFDKSGKPLMTTKLCLRFEAGACAMAHPGNNHPYPRFIERNGQKFRLEYLCDICRMEIVAE